MRLHRETFGSGEPAVFVHGSFGWGLDTFPDQRELADTYEVVLVDRHGYGPEPEPSPDAVGWPIDADAVAEVLAETDGAHLVGQSYGAVVALVAASRRPDLVRSLVVIEPPLLGIAAGVSEVDRLTQSLEPVTALAPGLTAREYLDAWAAAVMGMTPAEVDEWTQSWGPREWAAADASRRERWPGDAPVDIEALHAADIPKVVVTGSWLDRDGYGPSPTGAAFQAIAYTLAEAIDGRLVEFPSSAHNPQLEEPEAFNALLRKTWDEAPG